MKGIVLEKTPRGVIVMTPQGEFVHYESKGLSFAIGEEIDVPRRVPVFKSQRRFAALAASILLLITSGISYGLYFTPAGYVSIDVNPSVEIAYNRFERILGIKGLNPEGELIAEGLSAYRHDPLRTTISRVIDAIDTQGYLGDESKGEVLITVSDRLRSEAILEEVFTNLQENPVDYDIYLTAGSEENHLRYQVIGEKTTITPGKLNLIDKITPEPREIGPGTSDQGTGLQERNSLPENADETAELARYRSYETKGISELVTEAQQGKKDNPVMVIPRNPKAGEAGSPNENKGPEENNGRKDTAPGLEQNNENKDSGQDHKKNGGH